MSSKPMTEMSRGTRRPNSLIAPMAPMAVRSLEAKTAVGRRAGLEDALHGGVAAVDAVIAFLDESGAFGQVLLRGALLEGLEAGARGGERERAADEGDAAMAE